MHTPEIKSVQPTPSSVRYIWTCCDVVSDQRFRYRSQAVMDCATRHLHPDKEPPTHTAYLSHNGFGQVDYECSCGISGRPEGYISTRRARQAHSRHMVDATLTWYENVAAVESHRAKDSSDFQDRFSRLTPEGQTLTVERALEELL